MPITSVEQSSYFTKQQEFLAKARVGQWAKFLSRNHLFVTYYPINENQSRVDSGSKNAYEYIGPQSPVRYNKIKQLPVFNIPDSIRPDIIIDETGMDIESELSDLAFIPGTVRPKGGDCMRIDIPGIRPLLYQCTQYRHNSIQSNDFYLADFSLIDVDQEYLDQIERQVEEVYTCKYENIGTNNKVFLTEDESAAADDLNELIDKLSDFYKNAFYNADVDGFILYEGNAFGTQWYHDIMLTRFINESQIYCDDNSDYTITLPYLDLIPLSFDRDYSRTIWYAVLNRSKDYMTSYVYAWDSWIHNRTSPLVLYSIPAIGPNIHISDKYINPHEPIEKDLVTALPFAPGKFCGFDGVDSKFRFYFPYELQKSICENMKDDSLNHVEQIIFDYILRGPSAVKWDKITLIEKSFKVDMFTYMTMPIIIYILKQIANGTTAKIS